MKTFRFFSLLFLLTFYQSSPLVAQGRKNPTSAEAAEKVLAKRNKEKRKASEKAMKESKKNFAKMQTKEFRKSLKRNKRQQKRKARGLN